MTTALSPLPDLLALPPARAEAIRALAPYLRPGLRVALSTHINADGDGCGSEVAIAGMLAQLGMTPMIVNPTPWPEMFRFLLPDEALDQSPRGAAALREADAGWLVAGSRADLAVLDAPSYTHLAYRPGVPLVALTIEAGKIVAGARPGEPS